MKKIYFVFGLSFLLLSCGGNTSKKETTSSVDTISSANTISLPKDDIGDWQITNYVDEFNENTDVKYVVSKPMQGVFSNSATTNSRLNAVITADTGHTEIKLFEYEGNHQTKLNGDVIFKVKESNGDIHDLKTFEGYTFHNNREGNSSDSLFRAILSRGGEIKFKATISKYGNTSSYTFTMENADHFQDAINKTLDK